MATAPTIRVPTLRLPGGLALEFAEQGRLGGPAVLVLRGITDSWRSFEPDAVAEVPCTPG